jgi:hypothetical protein
VAFALVSWGQEPVASAVSGSCWSDFERNITYILEILHAQPLQVGEQQHPLSAASLGPSRLSTSNPSRKYECGIGAMDDIQQVQLQPRQVSQSAHSLRSVPILSNASRVFVLFLRRALTYLSPTLTDACMSLKPVRSFSENFLKACVRCATKLSTVSFAETATR